MNYELWKKQAEGEPVFIGYQRATNFVEAVANKLGIETLDRNEDQSIKMVDGCPVAGGEVIYPSKEDALAIKSTGENSATDSGTTEGGTDSGNTGTDDGTAGTGATGTEGTTEPETAGPGSDLPENAGVAETAGDGTNTGTTLESLQSGSASVIDEPVPTTEKEPVSEEPGATFPTADQTDNVDGVGRNEADAGNAGILPSTDRKEDVFIANGPVIEFGNQNFDGQKVENLDDEYYLSKSKQAENIPVDGEQASKDHAAQWAKVEALSNELKSDKQ